MADIQKVVQGFLAELVETGQEIGLQAAVYLEGKLIADCAAGVTAPGSREAIRPDTLFTVASCSKAVISTAFHLLAERGMFEYNKPVAYYWPEFGQAGKETITIAQVMNHVAGIPQTPILPEVPAWELWSDLNRSIAETAKLTPMFEPGSTSCYHALTIGWVLAGLVQQVDGRTLGQVVREEIAIPLGVQGELFLGTPAEVHGRLALMHDAPINPADLPAFDMSSVVFKIIPPAAGPLVEVFNRPEVRSAEVPAANISASARALARHYAALVSEVDGCRLISDERLRLIFAHEENLPDLFMNTPSGVPQDTPRILGYQKNTGREENLFYYGPNPQAFGHEGYGGSVGFADVQRKLGVGFTKNRSHSFVQPAPNAKLRSILPTEMAKTLLTKAIFAAL